MRQLHIVSIGCTVLGTLLLQVQAQTFEPLWTLTPGSKPYLTVDSTQRGMAVNPATGHLLVVNRAGGLSVNVLDAVTSADLGTLNVAGISGGTFPLNMIATGSDGAIYACNLTIDTQGSSGPLKIYRWADEAAAPQLVYSGDPSLGNPTASNRRFGDAIDVRGAGNAVQILVPSRQGTIVSLITTPDGSTYNASVINTDAGAGDVGLGLAFGAGDTFWATAPGRFLRQVDLLTGTTLLAFDGTVFPTSIAALGVDSVNGLLAGISLNTSPTPDSLNFYDINGLSTTSLNVPLDVENFPVDNANSNGTGDVAFWNNFVFALDSNNGLIAFTAVPEPSTLALALLGGLGLIAMLRRRRP